MRIVFVQSGIGAGGAEKVVNLLAAHRASLGDEVHVLAFTSRLGRSYFPYGDEIDLQILEQEGNTKNTSRLQMFRRLAWLRDRFRSLKPDVIVSFLTKTNVLVALASRGLPAKVVISERNNPYRQRAHPFWRVASRLAARVADSVVMQTEAALSTLSPRAQRRAIVIPNPCTTPPCSNRLATGAGRVVAVGRLDQQKGFDLLIGAFAEATREMPEVTLTIFGEGPEREALEVQVQALGLASRVFLPGVTDVPGAWLAAGDVFVLSSRFEGFPNVLVEALAGGLPVVAFDCPWGPGSIVTHEKDGLLVPAEDVDALSAALKRVLTDRKLRERLARSAPEAVSRFSLPNVLAEWDAIVTPKQQETDAS